MSPRGCYDWISSTLTRESRRPRAGLSRCVVKWRTNALVIPEDAVFISHAKRIAALAIKNQLRTIGFGEYAEAGGLLAFGVSFADLWRRAAVFVDKILRGARPADLPVERPTKFEVIINLKTAKVLGPHDSPIGAPARGQGHRVTAYLPPNQESCLHFCITLETLPPDARVDCLEQKLTA
mgnify:CR=1 FL=1